MCKIIDRKCRHFCKRFSFIDDQKSTKSKKKNFKKNLNNKTYNSPLKIILNNKTKNKKETLGAVTEMQHLFSPFEKECSVSVDNKSFYFIKILFIAGIRMMYYKRCC